MKAILVPTDFSTTAITAFRYALALAPNLGIKEIKLISVFHEPINFRDDSGYIAEVEIEKAKKNCEARLLDFIEVENRHSPLSILVTFEAIHGIASNAILDAAQNPNTELIVIGTTGIHDSIDKWLGTVSNIVVQKANRPILLIPNGTKYTPVTHLLYACDFSRAYFDVHTEGVVADIAKKLAARVDVVFVKRDARDYEADKKVMEKVFKMDAPDVPLNVKIIEGDSVVQTIRDYAISEDIDWMVLATEQRSFFQDLLHYSVSKKLALHPELPLLVTHAEDWRD
jgi:nucleotide-binding universal stress UspA family protein